MEEFTGWGRYCGRLYGGRDVIVGDCMGQGRYRLQYKMCGYVIVPPCTWPGTLSCHCVLGWDVILPPGTGGDVIDFFKNNHSENFLQISPTWRSTLYTINSEWRVSKFLGKTFFGTNVIH